MRLAEVLAQVDGLTKRFVHYLEAQGHIAPTRVAKQRIDRREYSADDVRRIAAIWRYYRRGFSVQNSVDLVGRSDRAFAYVMFDVPARRWSATLELMRGFENVLEASIVYGETEDIVLKLRAPEDGDIFAVLSSALRSAAISSLPTIYKVAAPTIARLGVDGEGEATMRAYVLVKASAKQVERVLEAMRGLAGIVEASATYGETDVICRIEVESQAMLDRLVMHDLHAIDAVESTRTYIVVSDLHWRRAPVELALDR